MAPLYGMNGAAVDWLEARDGHRGWSTANGSSIYQFATSATNATSDQMVINQLRFAAAKSVRTSTIILASFNTFAAFATAVGILFEGYSRERRNNGAFKFSRNGFSFVQPCDVFPLVLSVGITIQGIIFAAAQSTGMHSLVGLGCTQVSEIMLPGLLLVPYIQLVFGVDMFTRGLRSKPFARRKWGVTLCLVLVGLLTLTNFLVATFNRASDFCLTSLFWFAAHWSSGIFGILLAIASILLICTVGIFVRLTRSIKIDVSERVAASRMVYYLATAVISNTFMIPFFFTLAFGDSSSGDTDALSLSMVASVVANVTGLMTGGLYLFLKSNTISTIGPKDKAGEYERRRMKPMIRLHPVSPGSLRRVDSEASLVSYAKAEEAQMESPVRAFSPSALSPNPLHSNAVKIPTTAVLRSPEPSPLPPSSITLNSASPAGHPRERTLDTFKFPNNSPGAKSSVTLLPATTYSPDRSDWDDILQPPPSMGNLAVGRHMSNSSMISSATVQIGLRLSSMDDMQPLGVWGAAETGSVYDLSKDPMRPPIIFDAPAPKKPSPLQNTELRRSSHDDAVVDNSPVRDPVKNARMKTLPPVPRPDGTYPSDEEEEDSEYESDPAERKPSVADTIITLSPTVYSPASPSRVATKLPTPKGVGFVIPPQSKFSSALKPGLGGGLQRNASNPTPRSPAVTPPPPRRPSEATTAYGVHAKAEWI